MAARVGVFICVNVNQLLSMLCVWARKDVSVWERNSMGVCVPDPKRECWFVSGSSMLHAWERKSVSARLRLFVNTMQRERAKENKEWEMEILLFVTLWQESFPLSWKKKETSLWWWLLIVINPFKLQQFNFQTVCVQRWPILCQCHRKAWSVESKCNANLLFSWET